MPLISIIITACWLIFILVWAVSAINVKQDVNNKSAKIRRVLWYVRIIIFVLIISAVIERFIKYGASSLNFHPFWDYANQQLIFHSKNDVLGIAGATFCVLGIGLAVWARLHLGRNWSSHPTMKKDHELVTSGPYAFVRHPIYTGMLLAIFSSTLYGGWPWLIIFAIVIVWFVWRVDREERIMTKLFPDRYPEYRERTKALIPFIW